ncbi:MAG: hypothetical protein GY854_04455 [Deltaproteobacteria bacterium]|nr:hypothetical protein [Deltaproteobacteria bacterium]
MVWNKRIFGPGPERLTNLFISKIAAQIESNANVIKNWAPGVIVGLEPSFDEPGVFSIAPGAALSVGRYREFPVDEEGDAEYPYSVTVSDVAEDDLVWFFIDDNGELTYHAGGWPDHKDEPIVVENSYCVLGFAAYGADGWKDPRDVRRYVQTKPNDAELVVGDIADGADFETIQQALDYIEACDKGDRYVSRKIVVTEDQTISGTPEIHVRVPGVRLEANHSSGGLVEINGSIYLYQHDGQDLNTSIEGFIISTSAYTDAIRFTADSDVISGFSIRNCVLEAENNSMPFYVQKKDLSISKDVFLNRFVIEDCEINDIRANLFYSPQKLTLALRDSIIRNNILTCTMTPEDKCTSLGINSIDPENEQYYARDEAVINCHWYGTTPSTPEASSLRNIIEGNTISGGIVSVRVGRQDTVRNNVIKDAGLYGILVDAPGSQAMTMDAAIHGGTEISGNTISLWDEGVSACLKWWRSAIRLELSHCSVVDNRLDLNQQTACGVSEGYVQGLDSELGEYSIALELTKGHLCVAKHERAHGWITLTTINPMEEIRVGGSAVFSRTVQNVTKKFQAITDSYLPPDATATEPRTLQVFVVAEEAGDDSYVPGGGLVTHTGIHAITNAVSPAKVEEPGITGIFDLFRESPDGGHTIQGNTIEFIGFNTSAIVTGETGVPKPFTGFGVLLASGDNRVSGNTIIAAATGIFVLDRSQVRDNHIYSSWLGICVWRRSIVVGNEVWWWRDNLDGYSEHSNPLFVNSSFIAGICASLECTLENNKVFGLLLESQLARSSDKTLRFEEGSSSSSNAEGSYGDFMDQLSVFGEGFDEVVSLNNIVAASAMLSSMEPPSGSSSSSSDFPEEGMSSSSSTDAFGPMMDEQFLEHFHNAVKDINSEGMEEKVEALRQMVEWGTLVDMNEFNVETALFEDPEDKSATKYDQTDALAGIVMGLPPNYMRPGILIIDVPLMVYISQFRSPKEQLTLIQQLVAAFYIALVGLPAPSLPKVKDLWIFMNWGGNIVANNTINLYQTWTQSDYLNAQAHTGIISTSGFYAPKLVDWPDMAGLSLANNTLSSNSIIGGLFGCIMTSPDLVRDCRIEKTALIGLLPIGSTGPNVEGCEISGEGMEFPLYGSVSLSYYLATYILPRTVGTSISDTVLRGKFPGVMIVAGTNTRISDCRIENEQPQFSGPGIWWLGNFGSCVGCDFYCHTVITKQWMQENGYEAALLAWILETLWNPTAGIIFGLIGWIADFPVFWPAIWYGGIVYSFETPREQIVFIYQPATQGNLVTGAQMSGCWPAVGTSIPRIDTKALELGVIGWSPIWCSGNNPLPPEQDEFSQNSRWTNRVDWRGCWFWTLDEFAIKFGTIIAYLLLLS